ncbi:hypothetical protein B0H11DRAFT_2184467 [Mycena galericulata]|nr:hypothetical protein B0H11DRAFT_2184467 [Mycena galericulata]
MLAVPERSAASFKSAAQSAATVRPVSIHVHAVARVAPACRAGSVGATKSYQVLPYFHARATSGYQTLAESYAVPNNGDLSTWLSQISELLGGNNARPLTALCGT